MGEQELIDSSRSPKLVLECCHSSGNTHASMDIKRNSPIELAPSRSSRDRMRSTIKVTWLRLGGLALVTVSITGCDGAPSRNILGSYFPSWMVCALVGIALALIARSIFKASGLLSELPTPFLVMLAIACAGTFASWLVWLS